MPDWLESDNIRDTAFTVLTPSGVKLREDRPVFMVSSTSWTADEDFGLLLEALDKYQERKSSPEGKNLPRVMMIITGRGGLRKQFVQQVAAREALGQWPDVAVRCMFVSARDYPLLLGCGDLGISMHQSSSGRDLPMKVVDMFGCGVPVLARGFACIDELVKDGVNGRVFNTSAELADQLIVRSAKTSADHRTLWPASHTRPSSRPWTSTSTREPVPPPRCAGLPGPEWRRRGRLGTRTGTQLCAGACSTSSAGRMQHRDIK